MKKQEGLQPKGIEKVLTSEELRDLYLLMEDPGWYSLMKVKDQVREQWAKQHMNFDYKSVSDDGVIKDFIEKQGMWRGLDGFFSYLESKKKKTEEESKK